MFPGTMKYDRYKTLTLSPHARHRGARGATEGQEGPLRGKKGHRGARRTTEGQERATEGPLRGKRGR